MLNEEGGPEDGGQTTETGKGKRLKRRSGEKNRRSEGGGRKGQERTEGRIGETGKWGSREGEEGEKGRGKRAEDGGQRSVWSNQ